VDTRFPDGTPDLPLGLRRVGQEGLLHGWLTLFVPGVTGPEGWTFTTQLGVTA
jgi:hypothetical protein